MARREKNKEAYINYIFTKSLEFLEYNINVFNDIIVQHHNATGSLISVHKKQMQCGLD